MPLLFRSKTLWACCCLFVAGLIWNGFFPAMAGAAASGAQDAQKPPARGIPSATAQPAAPKPSLDTLAARVKSFWNLIMRGQKSEALQYVELSGRKYFEAWQITQISEPRITTLELTSKPEEVAVKVEMNRTFPPMPATFVWPVMQNWIFRNGNWFVRVEPSSIKDMFPAGPGQVNSSSPNSEEIEKRQKEMRAALQFDNSRLDFGRVSQGDIVSLSLGYKLAGKEPFGIFLKDSPQDFIVRNIVNRTLPPGDNQKIQMQLLTRSYAGAFHQKFTAVISYQQAEISYDFEIHGYVYVPVYATPSVLSFRSGEREKEVVVTNDSKSEVTIRTMASKDFAITPLPQKLPPGGACTLKVSLLQDAPQKNYTDSFTLDFDMPVEDMRGLELSIIRNHEVVEPAKAQELQLRELVKKSGVPIKK